MNLENEKLLRLKDVLVLVPVSKSTWWAGVKSGRFPTPFKLGPKTTVWRSADIKKIYLGPNSDIEDGACL